LGFSNSLLTISLVLKRRKWAFFISLAKKKMAVPLLTTTEEVARLALDLARETSIAVDLEADSMHSYREKVCLLQVTLPGRTVLLDPLAGPDLSSLAPVLGNPGIRKIFHAADYDLRCLHRDFGLEVRGLFDTMIACQLLGEERVGLADVLAKYFAVDLDKKFQRADWSVRPLSDEMQHYAAEDTRHLHRLADLLESRLREAGRLYWAEEEFRLLESVRFSETKGPLFLKVKGAGRLDRRALGILEDLLQWREKEACRRDRPPFRIIGNRSLIEAALTAPQTQKGLVGIEGISPRLAERYGRDLLRVIKSSQDRTEGDLPQFPRQEKPPKDPEADLRFELLRKWRLARSSELSMDPGVLINNAALEEIARRFPHKWTDLEMVPGIKKWQLEELGDDILKLLRVGKRG